VGLSIAFYQGAVLMQLPDPPEFRRRAQICSYSIVSVGQLTLGVTKIAIASEIPTSSSYHSEQCGCPFQCDVQVTPVQPGQNVVGDPMQRLAVSGIGNTRDHGVSRRERLPSTPVEAHLLGVYLAPLLEQVQRPERAWQAHRVRVLPELGEGVDTDSVGEIHEPIAAS
jgi:hypothetical protein